MTRPRGYCWGPTARDVQFAQGALRSVITGVVVDFEWSWIQPSNPAVLDPAAVAQVHTWLDWCETNAGVTGKPLQVHLRPRVGLYAPDFVRQAAGTMRWWFNDGQANFPAGTTGTPAPSGAANSFEYLGYAGRPHSGGMPRWWMPSYESALATLYTLLWQEFGARTIVVEIDYGWPSTHYMEPCLKQWAIQDNLKSAITDQPVGEKWTETRDDELFAAGWTHAMSTWGTTRHAIFTSYNPCGQILVDATTYSGIRHRPDRNIARTIRLMEKQLSICGGLTLWANESFVNPWNTASGAEQVAMYQRMIDGRQAVPPVANALQTETDTKIDAKNSASGGVTNVVDTVREAAKIMRSVRVEIPINCQTFDPAHPNNYFTPAIAAEVAPLFWENLDGLTGPEPPTVTEWTEEDHARAAWAWLRANCAPSTWEKFAASVAVRCPEVKTWPA